MKYAAVVLALAASAFAQSLQDLPPCSINCLVSAVSASGCGVDDPACQCGAKRADIEAAVTPCLQSSCTADEQAKVLQITGSICASAGGGSAGASGAASSAAGAASSAAASVSSGATAAASAPATQSSSAAGERYGVAGALIAGAALLAL